jgi:23S rRNA (adenine2503-C2)-methyltransferase
MTHDLLSYDRRGLDALMASLDKPSWHVGQLMQWLWQQSASSYGEMTNLPVALRERLAVTAPLQRATVAARLNSTDGARKYLLSFADGTTVETVGIPGTGTSDRLTVCVSSQAGCALGCVFCATGKQGLVRDLGGGEMAEQVRIAQEDFERSVTNVVVMGQGEPFSNYDATLGALRILNDPQGLRLGARHITVSTSGIISGVERLATEPEQFRLAISLHAATQELRDRLMPGLAGQPLAKLRQALIDYREKSGRRVSLEYILLQDVNDRPSDLQALADFAQATRSHLNLLPYNQTKGPTKGPDPFVSSPRAREAAEFLRQAGIETTVRRSRGSDIAAACGQLAGTTSS